MSDKDKYHMTLLMCIPKKTATNELILQKKKKKKTHRLRELTFSYQRGRVGERDG